MQKNFTSSYDLFVAKKTASKKTKNLNLSLPKPPFELLDHEDGQLVGQEVLDALDGGLVASSEHAEITHTQNTADNYIWISICKPWLMFFFKE